MRLIDRGIDIRLSDSATEYLVRVGYDPAYGARPVKRAIQKELENRLAHQLLNGTVQGGQIVEIDYDASAGELSFQPVPLVSPAV
jgi:ATP-dependent Clp protease ATP-binding subunit ClpB